jgi:flagellar protein FliO/FliZ
MNHAVDWARTFGGLFVVLAMIVAAGWLLRRLQQRAGMAPGGRHGRVKVVVVEVEGTWLVLGVTQQQVQTLHSLPRPADVDAPASGDGTPGTKPPAFADALADQIKRRLTGKSQ